MKILALSERAQGGGLECYLQTVAEGFRARGSEMRLLTRADLGFADEHDAPRPEAGARLRELASSFGPDAIAIHNVLDAEVIAAAGPLAPTVYHFHDHRLFCPNGDRVFPRGRKRCGEKMGAACLIHSALHGCAYGPRSETNVLLQRRRATAAAALATGAIVVYSEFMEREALANGVPQPLLHRLRPPIPPAFLREPRERDRTRTSVFFGARIEPVKGLQHLVRAIAAIPHERRPLLTIAGEGPDLAASLALADRLGCEVRALGTLDRDGVIAALDACTIAAMPSLWNEPFGLSGVEAFARARPVAAYVSGGIPEWIGEGGIAVPCGDIRALRSAIETLLEEARWQTCSRSAREIAQTYSLEPHLDELIGVYGGSSLNVEF